MKAIYKKVMEEGTIVKIQTFDASNGVYMLAFARYKGEIFMFKYKDGKLVECVNLSKAKEF